MRIAISEIKIGKNRRSLSEKTVTELMGSINKNGLINAITISSDNYLIAGLHRLEACKRLKDTNIKCRRINCEYNDNTFRLLEIDENLIRSELTEIEKSQALKERKTIYEAMYPETKAKYNASNKTNDNVPFVSDTANKIGVSKRTVERSVQIANNIENLNDLKGTIIEDNKSELLKIAKQPKKKQDKVIQAIKSGKAKSVSHALHIEKIQQQRKDIEDGTIEIPKGQYEVIVIDPPWQYSSKEDAGYDKEGFRGTTDYPTMTVEAIKGIKLPSSENCVLWLWTTQKHLRYAFEILDVWGFKDVAILTWCKNKMGIGKWLRSKSEFCIMSIKGKPIIDLTNQTTVLNADVREHSRKPDEFYTMVSELCIGRKLDYFSREKRKGWDTFGTKEF